MKITSFILLSMTMMTSGIIAQDLTSKKGEPILPEINDWSIGIDATPFFGYLGNAFNGNSSNNSPSWNFLNTNQTIIGKFFKNEKLAYRGIARIGMGSVKSVKMIKDANAATPTYPVLPTMVEDSWTRSYKTIGLGAGIEKRKGITRLQGFYGADAMLWIKSSKDKYKYGNALSPSIVADSTTTTNFGSNVVNVKDSYDNPARVIEQKSGTTIGLGVRAFIGAEYFILPKISIGCDFGWGIGFETTGKGSTTIESVNPSPVAVGPQNAITGRSSSITLDVNRDVFGSANGALRVNLHF